MGTDLPSDLSAPRSATPAVDLLVTRGVLVLAAYFLLQVIVRLLMPTTLNLDEAEQILQSRDFRLGYGPQPPLYTWLQWLVFRITGPSVLGLSLLKNLLLVATYVFTYASARVLLGSKAVAAVAAASLLFIPQIAWEAQRDLTHSVLATACAAALLYGLVMAIESGKRRWFVFLGVALGAGLLAKYSFVLSAGALLASAASVAATRQRLLRPALVLTLLIAAAMALSHYLWILGDLDQVVAPTLKKLRASEASPLPFALAVGWAGLLEALFLFLTPLWLVYALVLLRRPPAGAALPLQPDPKWRGLLYGYAAAVVIGVTLVILVTGATSFKDRWMMPLGFLAPLAALLLLHRHLTRRRLEYLARGAALCAAAVLLAMVLRLPVTGALGRPVRLNAPLAELAADLTQRGWASDVILADENFVAGSLQLHLREALLVNATSPLRPRPTRTHCGVTLVWANHPDEPPSQLLRERFSELTGRSWPESDQTLWEQPYDFSSILFRVGIARSGDTCIVPQPKVKPGYAGSS